MINVTFPTGIKELTIPAVNQWDYGQRLAIYGLNLPQTVQVHFCDKSCSQAIVRFGNYVTDHTEVAIPDSLLENTYDNHAFIFVTSYEIETGVTAETTGTYYTKNGNVYTAVTLPEDYVAGTTYYYPCGQTAYKITIPIIGRTKPENFIDPLTPDEQTMLEEMIQAVNGTLSDIEALYDDTITVPDLQQMIRETTVDNATNATNATNADNVSGTGKLGTTTGTSETNDRQPDHIFEPNSNRVKNATNAYYAGNADIADQSWYAVDATNLSGTGKLGSTTGTTNDTDRQPNHIFEPNSNTVKKATLAADIVSGVKYYDGTGVPPGNTFPAESGILTLNKRYIVVFDDDTILEGVARIAGSSVLCALFATTTSTLISTSQTFSTANIYNGDGLLHYDCYISTTITNGVVSQDVMGTRRIIKLVEKDTVI